MLSKESDPIRDHCELRIEFHRPEIDYHRPTLEGAIGKSARRCLSQPLAHWAKLKSWPCGLAPIGAGRPRLIMSA
jgi:hypothetical protein